MLTYNDITYSYTCMCSVQCRNLWNLKIVLCILKIQKLPANLKTAANLEIAQNSWDHKVQLREHNLKIAHVNFRSASVFPLAAIAQSLTSTAVGHTAFRERPIQNLTTLLWSLLCMDSGGKVASIVVVFVFSLAAIALSTNAREWAEDNPMTA